MYLFCCFCHIVGVPAQSCQIITPGVEEVYTLFPQLSQDTLRYLDLQRECPEVWTPLHGCGHSLYQFWADLLEPHTTLLDEDLEFLYLTGERDLCLEHLVGIIPSH